VPGNRRHFVQSWPGALRIAPGPAAEITRPVSAVHDNLADADARYLDSAYWLPGTRLARETQRSGSDRAVVGSGSLGSKGELVA